MKLDYLTCACIDAFQWNCSIDEAILPRIFYQICKNNGKILSPTIITSYCISQNHWKLGQQTPSSNYQTVSLLRCCLFIKKLRTLYNQMLNSFVKTSLKSKENGTWLISFPIWKKGMENSVPSWIVSPSEEVIKYNVPGLFLRKYGNYSDFSC